MYKCASVLFSKWPVDPGDALLYDAPDLLEYTGVFLVHPVCQVSSVIQDLTGERKRWLHLFFFFLTCMSEPELPCKFCLCFFLYGEVVKIKHPCQILGYWNTSNVSLFLRSQAGYCNTTIVKKKHFPTYHVRLPTLSVHTAVNTPPEVVLRLPLPGEHRHACDIMDQWCL